MATKHRWNRGAAAPREMITMNDARGRLCCRADRPEYLCKACEEAYRRGMTRNEMVANAAAETDGLTSFSGRREMRPGDMTAAFVANGQGKELLAWYRQQGLDSKTYGQIERRVHALQRDGLRQPVHNCSCQNPDEDMLVAPTQAQMLRIAEPVTNSSMAPGELGYAGLCDSDDTLVQPVLNYEQIAANAIGRSGNPNEWVGGGTKGQWTQSARDSVNVPGFNFTDAMYAQDNDDRDRYPREGAKPAPVLTSGRPRVRPTVPGGERSPYAGQDVASYPKYGTVGDQGSTDSYGDPQEDTDEAAAGLGNRPGRRGGQRSDRGDAAGHYYPTSGPAAQYDAPMLHEDRTSGTYGQVKQAGRDPIYAADFFSRQTPGQLGVGSQPLPDNYEGQSYERSPTQSEDDYRRQFGTQPKPRGMTGNVEADQLVAPRIDWKALSAENASRK
jgi:hypothetical protein